MSLKVDGFAATFSIPKTVDKFYIQLPGSSKSLFRVSATSLPLPSRSEGVIWFLGQPLYLPTSQQASGEWSCSIAEDAGLGTLAMISALERRCKAPLPNDDSVNIFITDQITGLIPQLAVTLRFAWLKSVTPLELDWSKPDQVARWNLTFKYSAIKRWY